MYRVLKGEMVKNGITVRELALKIGITERGLRNKINGKTSFSWDEVLKIKTEAFPDALLEELFQKDENNKKQTLVR
ncbi:hypothetical protein A8806_110124 [Faecalicatena orotica]|uniref:Transcriptional regulator n=1 Tax=Faecalicatena orotica TaxID=1544 RepID=A0A2Y9BGB0_9FIRM|nr:DUF6471 domain-containing protein [Faecalicatena orotica]PWJ27949.1 hypothetical protein A8806_110124 [Faecalicatena orotica]SSA56972.1 hypothetical protein SAMN05216536_110124 [Faecalicatena orotica]